MRSILALALSLTILTETALAGLRAAGEYTGVVIFDRWDACYLYSGTYLMPVSEKAKEQLRGQSGRFVRVNAAKVFQPINPGDGLIQEFTTLPPKEPVATSQDELIRSLELKVTLDLEDLKIPRAVIALRNIGKKSIRVNILELAPTLFKKITGTPGEHWRSPADGPSYAYVTRFNLASTKRYADRLYEEDRPFEIDALKAPESTTLTLAPSDTQQVVLSLSVPAGEYDLIVGYAGGVHESEPAVSNLLAFDVDALGHFKELPDIRRSGR